MPDIKYPNGVTDYVNLNKDSTHPNPWKPPSRWDQLGNSNTAAYKIYKPQWENWMLTGDPGSNMFAKGPIGDRLGLWAYRGFVAGLFVSWMDAIYLTQSRSIKTTMARFLYLTPPVMALPVSYIVAREVLDKVPGDKGPNERWWPYLGASLAPAAIWGVFRNNFFIGMRMYFYIAGASLILKLGEELTGKEDRKIWDESTRINMDNKGVPPFYFTTLKTIRGDDPGPVYPKFLKKDD